MKLHFYQIERHRKGISGAPFHAVTFQDSSEGRMVAVVFDQESYVAVFNLDQLSVGNIAFGENSWRGDQYESHLRKAITEHEPTWPCEAAMTPSNQQRADLCQKAIVS